MPEKFTYPEDEPQILLIDGKDVIQYLIPALQEDFIRTLVTAISNGGVFDERYFKGYMKLFERRVQDGKVTLLLVNVEPAALGAIDIAGIYPDGRIFYELGNFVTLPRFQGQGFASRLIEYCFSKIRTNFPNDPILTTTREPKIGEKFLRLGMKEQSILIEMKVRNPRQKFLQISDEEYESKMAELAKEREIMGFKNYFFEPLESQ